MSKNKAATIILAALSWNFREAFVSTFDYIAGASVERGINEAIRVEEARSHGAELREISRRLQNLTSPLG